MTSKCQTLLHLFPINGWSLRWIWNRNNDFTDKWHLRIWTHPPRTVEICYGFVKEVRCCRMRATQNHQPHESCVQNFTKDRDAKSRKQDKEGDRSGTVLIYGRKETANAVHILRIIMEYSTEVQQDLYLCFIDYTKAFDTVKHQEIMKMLEHKHRWQRYKIIKSMY